MKLSFIERVYLLSLLPAEGDFTTLKIIRDLKSALSFSEQEHQDFKIKVDGENLTWDLSVEQDKEIDIGPKAHTIISDTLILMEKEKKLKLEHLSLYEKFVETS